MSTDPETRPPQAPAYCPDCGGRRSKLAVLCPHCGRPGVYALRTTVTDIDMPFWSMVNFMIKWALASVPALIGLVILIAGLVSCVSGLGGGGR